jgi:hypothetical protein
MGIEGRHNLISLTFFLNAFPAIVGVMNNTISTWATKNMALDSGKGEASFLTDNRKSIHSRVFLSMKF